MSHSSNDFDAFIKQRVEASDAFVNGNVDPLGNISVQESPASLFAPKGDYVQGAEQVNAANAKGAKHFGPDSTNALDVLHSAAGDTFAYWVGIQHAVAHMEGEKQPVRFDLRVTELFRLENGTWKLFHRHADPLKSGDAA